MGAAAGNSANVLGDVNVTTVGVAQHDTYTIGIEIGKLSGFDLPNHEKNATLGYRVDQAGFGDTY